MSKFLKVKNLSLSFLIAIGLFILTRPILVSALIQIQQEDKQVFETEIRADENGYSQVIIKDSNGKITFLTDEPLTHANSQISGRKVVWMAQIESRWQIFLYDISAEKTTQLTNKGNNVNPQISGDYVAWEGIRDDAWQILLFDGIKIIQLTQGDAPKQDVVIEGNTIAYSQKEGDVWQVYLFNIVDETFTKVSDQNSARNPVIDQELITWKSFDDEGEVYFEYDMKDKKLRKLAQKVEKPTDTPVETIAIVEPVEVQPTPEPVTEEDIIEELDLEEIVEVSETPESTPSNDKVPSLEDLLDVEDTGESTTSGD